MIEEFNKYTSNYDLNNIDVKLKYNHSIRVMNLCVKYAKLLNYSEEDIRLAKMIGLLHDIGRFEQLRVYNSYNDVLTVDHANLGVKILFEDNVIDRFTKDEREKEIIEFAIYNHNKLFIEDTLDNQKLMHAKLIRDIDKIDIIYLLGYLKELNLKSSEDKIRKKLINDFKKHKLISKNDIKNKNESLLLKFCFPFDINNDICLKELKENFKYFYEQIEGEKYFKEVFEELNKYIDERTCKNVRK